MTAILVGLPSIATSPAMSSCRPLIALLDESDAVLKQFALEKLDAIVDNHWAEVADHIEEIEQLYEDEKFQSRSLAALVASKVHYHLEQYTESLTYALGAGTLFTDQIYSGKASQYIFTIMSKVVDKYIQERNELESNPESPPIDSRLESIVESMFARSIQEGNIKQAVGIALESRRLDKLQECIAASQDRPGSLLYTLEACQNLGMSRNFRKRVLEVLVDLFQKLHVPDYQHVCQCLMLLENGKSVAGVLDDLIKSPNEADELLAYQIAFDLCESELQHFLSNVRRSLPVIAAAPAEAAPADSGAAESQAKPEGGDHEMKEASAEGGTAESAYAAKLGKLGTILSGETLIDIHLEFLFHRNKTDKVILSNIKSALEVRNSVTHQATVFANAVMHSGTTVDTFVAENLEWLKKATNWAKFSATACLGMIFKGCVKSSLERMKEYLPKPTGGMSSSPFSEGGALYALGLIHANHGEKIIKYISDALRRDGGAGPAGGGESSHHEAILHGGCLGLGLAAMATENQELYEQLKDILFQDQAVAGEGAGLAMGLVMLGTASETAIEEMFTYAHETQHEKIIRGLAMGLALVMYGREEGADGLIEQLTRDKDPILRYGGMYTIAMAYSGTGNNSAIRRLLHVAVSDVSDDVRRAAVTCLGFVLTKLPEQCPRVVSLLAESYNPHVRYGATLAVGIACAGTALQEAVDLLEPMTKDATDYVRQGAMLALAMVLIQENDVRTPKVKDIRSHFESVIKDKHEDVMAKHGAIFASSILDAGGRNVTISLTTKAGHKRMSGIVGMAVFCQYWYWFPMAHFISLTFTPTCLIGLNKDLKMPVTEFLCQTKPSLFDYPPPTEIKTKQAPTKVATAILSTTAKTEARKKTKKEDEDKMEVVKEGKDESKDSAGGSTTTAAGLAVAGAGAAAVGAASESKGGETKPADGKEEASKKEGEEAEGEKKETDKKKEPSFSMFSNPARIIPAQKKFVTIKSGSRFETVSKHLWGVVMLRDLKPEDESSLVTITVAAAGVVPEEEEPPPPEPFEYREE